jgi:hypothetical protein
MSLAKWRYEALEKVWLAEVENRLPFQSNARAFSKLAAEGLLQEMESSGRDGFGSWIFRGWQLTHAGRFLYCSTCEDEADEPQRGRDAP